MRYILQAFAGTWREARAGAEEIARRVCEVSSRICVDKLIVGWNADGELYERLASSLRGSGIGMLLWLPVFSETGGIADPDPALDLWGRRLETRLDQEGEDFEFLCPSSRRNIGIVKGIYEKYFSGCGFNGVFLDRIRTQSFVAGVPGVLSCGCRSCREAFRRRGVDIGAVRELYDEKRDAFFDMASYPADGRFALRDEEAQRFFDAKEEIVSSAVDELCGWFKDRGMAVGLDLFAPFVSRFVGQDYPRIARRADFVKPMLYRRTDAPAGVGYEYALFQKHAPGAKGRAEMKADIPFLRTQLEAAKAAGCAVYPGIEICRDGRIARADAGYITESLKAVKACGFPGAALCWDIMRAPREHIDAVAELESRFGA